MLHQRRNLEAKWRHDKQADAVERTRKQQRQLRDEQLLRQSTGLRGILRNNRPPLTPPPLGDAPLKDGVKGGTNASQNWSNKMYSFISHPWDCDIDTLIFHRELFIFCSPDGVVMPIIYLNLSPVFISFHKFLCPPFTLWMCFLG